MNQNEESGVPYNLGKAELLLSFHSKITMYVLPNSGPYLRNLWLQTSQN